MRGRFPSAREAAPVEFCKSPARCRTGPAAKPWPGAGEALMMHRATAEEERA